MASTDNCGFSDIESQSSKTLLEYEEILFQESVSEKFKNFTHAAHGMLYALDDRLVFGMFRQRAAILMQLRFDGILGFPGGLVDPGENPMEALNREMEEEINLDLTQHPFTNDNHLVTFLHHKKQLVLHFFTKEVSLDQFKNIELKSLNAKEYGLECFGSIRPPLFTMEDGFKGLPAFLSNQFAGNSREQLLYALKSRNIITSEEIATCVESMKRHVENNR
ncbi:hypothetical protein LOTGIDRAFT_116649 [Lottia gigantea]|uniref:U8 snoRNA-decapping enzyme n=1 Tax=Lottia gigantea TaxID=225164 RepID=V4AFN3_LOTGI|nr:hypothetical protein LOTGIDRAFT_116649 [Lottia gigantea]ESO95697.1 hypothetical protein LOTGIDRAFT_116649 [Lottia gigantea]